MYDHGDLDRVVISPGPGHPRTDSGISRDVLTWGIGKIPILGVCMGLECLVDVLGGEVSASTGALNQCSYIVRVMS
jgi:anthranilate synthase/indole-3-glycerol phosphate synthase/phosphoribosylanthranilate isomerase